MSTTVTTSVLHSEASPVAPQLPPSACGCLCGSFALMSDYYTPAYHASHQEHGIEAAASHLPVSVHVVIHYLPRYDQDTTAGVRRDFYFSRAVVSS